MCFHPVGYWVSVMLLGIQVSGPVMVNTKPVRDGLSQVRAESRSFLVSCPEEGEVWPVPQGSQVAHSWICHA